MSGLIARRLGASALLTALILVLSFGLAEALPGGPGGVAEDPRVSPAQAERLRAAWGLDRPVTERFLRFVGGTVRGDWGPSLSRQRPVAEVLADAIPWTLLLAAAGLAIEFVLGLALGLAAARRPGGAVDHLVRAAAVTIHSIPTFWLALGLLALFALHWQLLPAGGIGDPTASGSVLARIVDLLRHVTLPALAVGLPAAGGLAHLVRATLVDPVDAPLHLAARARGLRPARRLLVHRLPLAAAPLLQAAGLSIGSALSGALAAEAVFGWPGVGRIALDALAARDHPLLIASAGLAAFGVVVGSAVAELLHAGLDPRVRDA